MFAGKPIIGIVGGIGAGKSFVAALFGQAGCLVIDSDAQVREVYLDPKVLQTVQAWWGRDVLDGQGRIDRKSVARIIFASETERKRLECLIHPLVSDRREQVMAAAAGDRAVVAYVWDTPLLVEVGLHRQCDALVFVEASREDRLAHVTAHRGWDAAELERRQNLQLPLDMKREISDYHVVNTADAGYTRDQVREILSRIVTGLP